MKKYQQNSAEAIASIISLFILADRDISHTELDTLDCIALYKTLKIDRKDFISVFKNLCDDISNDIDENGRINILDPVRVDRLLQDITDRKKQYATLAVALDICKSDDVINEPEMALLQYIMKEWQISLESLEASIPTLSF